VVECPTVTTPLGTKSLDFSRSWDRAPGLLLAGRAFLVAQEMVVNASRLTLILVWQIADFWEDQQIRHTQVRRQGTPPRLPQQSIELLP
jgi:hypothetical protein